MPSAAGPTTTLNSGHGQQAFQSGSWNNSLEGVGTNLLDGGAPFYGTYTCADGKHLSVGAIEPQFYAALLQGLGLADDAELPDQFDRSGWAATRRRFAQVVGGRTRDAWVAHFDELGLTGPSRDSSSLSLSLCCCLLPAACLLLCCFAARCVVSMIVM